MAQFHGLLTRLCRIFPKALQNQIFQYKFLHIEFLNGPLYLGSEDFIFCES